MDRPAATVIIPARDAARTIGATVRAVLHQTDRAGRPVEVVVVDDGSLDDTGAVARAAGAEVLRAGGDGPARARNLGLARARAPLVVFTDADCEPEPEFVAALLAPLEDPAIAGSKGVYVTRQREWVARFVQVEYEERYARMAGRAAIDFVDTYAAAYRREVLEAVGGFDERYRLPSTEDQELSFRVAALGHRLVFAPEARVAHLHVATLWGYARKKHKIGRFKLATLRRHPGKAVRDSHTPLTLKLEVLLAPLAAAGALAAPLLALGGASARPLGLPLAAWALGPAAAFALLAAPLCWRVARRDPPVALVAPLLVAVRALALGLGLLSGLLAEVRGGLLAPAGAAPDRRTA